MDRVFEISLNLLKSLEELKDYEKRKRLIDDCFEESRIASIKPPDFAKGNR